MEPFVMNRHRLETLIVIMKNVKAKQEKLNKRLFNINDWFGSDSKQEIFETDFSGAIVNGEEQFTACGTTACALGWACLNDNFNRQGLVALKGADGQLDPFYNGYSGLTAAIHFFGLTHDEASFLFYNTTYEVEDHFKDKKEVTPDDVIRHIYYLLDNNGLNGGDPHNER